ncbi:MAG: hypothetical protein AB8G11_19995 [Saprospiraceae bacterium]
MGFIVALIFIFLSFWSLRGLSVSTALFFDDVQFMMPKKEMKIWFPSWIFRLIDISSQLIFAISLLIGFVLISEEKWASALPFVIITIIGIFYYRFRDKFTISLGWSISSIQNIDKNGFEIHIIKNGQIKSIKKFFWKNITKASLTKNELRLQAVNGQKIYLNTSTKNFYSLIKQVPKNFTDITSQQVNTYFKDLNPCLVCGAIAANGFKCNACETHIWKKSFDKYYPNKQAYIKSKQLDLFASLQKNGQQAITFNRDETFHLHKNWKLLVSEKEIKEYSQKSWWIL